MARRTARNVMKAVSLSGLVYLFLYVSEDGTWENYGDVFGSLSFGSVPSDKRVNEITLIRLKVVWICPISADANAVIIVSRALSVPKRVRSTGTSKVWYSITLRSDLVTLFIHSCREPSTVGVWHV